MHLEVTLGIPRDWWFYQKPNGVLGWNIAAFGTTHPYPIEALLVWLAVTFDVVMAFEAFKGITHDRRSTRHRAGRGCRAALRDEPLSLRDKCSLDIFWLKDESLEDSSKLPDPDVLAAEIAEDLRSALEQIESVLGDLQQRARVIERGEKGAN